MLGVRAVRFAAAPMLALNLQVSEPSGRPVYMIALTIQLMIDPARRRYDDATRAKLIELFGEPERWAVTTRSLVWCKLDVLVPAFTGSTTVAVPIACNYDLEVTAAKYLHSLPDGEAPLALHFNGVVYYRGDDGGLQMVLVPWTRSVDFRMPVAVWKETIEHYYPNTGWVALRSETLEALQRAKLDRGHATFDACVAELLERPVVADALEQLVESLLYEGYALYPYTPGASKNSTPTPFGIVYPPAYAQTLASTFDHLELRCGLQAPRDAVLRAEVRFLIADGERHQAAARRIELPGGMVGALALQPAEKQTRIERARRAPPLVVGCVCRGAGARRRQPMRWRCASRTGPSCAAVSTGPERSLARCCPRTRSCGSRVDASFRRSSVPTTASTRSRCSRRPRTMPSSARRSCCLTTRRSRLRAVARCSTRLRSRRHCCFTFRS